MKIRILSPSDGASNEVAWGDYWVKKDLEAEFGGRGYEVVDKNADLDFCLFGTFATVSRMTAHRRFCWVYSHPNLIRGSGFSSHFEHVFVLSKALLPRVDYSTLLLGGSSKKFTPRNVEAEYDIVFLGNSGKPRRVEIVNYLCGLNKYRILLAGGWGRVEGADFAGSYINNSDIGQFFNRGLLSFYSAHEDMRVEGFVAVRILDIFRSSENLCISDDNVGLGDMFRNIPVYRSNEELVEMVDWFLENPKARVEVASRCRKDAEQWTFGRVVDEIERWI